MSLLKRIEKKDPAQTLPPPSGAGSGGAATPPPSSGQMARQMQTPAPPVDKLVELRARLLSKIIAELDPKLDIGRADELRRSIEELFNQFLAEEPDIVLGRVERQRLL
ncbi:MAG: type II secretion system protein E, partial [Chloroflexi bacterium]